MEVSEIVKPSFQSADPHQRKSLTKYQGVSVHATHKSEDNSVQQANNKLLCCKIHIKMHI